MYGLLHFFSLQDISTDPSPENGEERNTITEEAGGFNYSTDSEESGPPPSGDPNHAFLDTNSTTFMEGMPQSQPTPPYSDEERTSSNVAPPTAGLGPPPDNYNGNNYHSSGSNIGNTVPSAPYYSGNNVPIDFPPHQQYTGGVTWQDHYSNHESHGPGGNGLQSTVNSYGSDTRFLQYNPGIYQFPQQPIQRPMAWDQSHGVPHIPNGFYYGGPRLPPPTYENATAGRLGVSRPYCNLPMSGEESSWFPPRADLSANRGSRGTYQTPSINTAHSNGQRWNLPYARPDNNPPYPTTPPNPFPVAAPGVWPSSLQPDPTQGRAREPTPSSSGRWPGQHEYQPPPLGIPTQPPRMRDTAVGPTQFNIGNQNSGPLPAPTRLRQVEPATTAHIFLPHQAPEAHQAPTPSSLSPTTVECGEVPHRHPTFSNPTKTGVDQPQSAPVQEPTQRLESDPGTPPAFFLPNQAEQTTTSSTGRHTRMDVDEVPPHQPKPSHPAPHVTPKKRKVPGDDGETELPSVFDSPIPDSNSIQPDSPPPRTPETYSGFQIFDHEGNLLPKDTPFKVPNKRTKRAPDSRKKNVWSAKHSSSKNKVKNNTNKDEHSYSQPTNGNNDQPNANKPNGNEAGKSNVNIRAHIHTLSKDTLKESMEKLSKVRYDRNKTTTVISLYDAKPANAFEYHAKRAGIDEVLIRECDRALASKLDKDMVTIPPHRRKIITRVLAIVVTYAHHNRVELDGVLPFVLNVPHLPEEDPEAFPWPKYKHREGKTSVVFRMADQQISSLDFRNLQYPDLDTVTNGEMNDQVSLSGVFSTV